MEVRNEHICTLHTDILRGSAITNMEKVGKIEVLSNKINLYEFFFIDKFFDKHKQKQ
jgi:hypothetical protein